MGRMPTGAIGTFSNYTFELMQFSGEIVSAALKRAALLFDSLVFHPQGTLVGLDTGERPAMTKTEWLSVFASGDEEERNFLMKSDDFDEMVILTDEFVKNAPDFYRNVDSIFERQDLFQTVQKWASHELESRGILETNDRRNWMYMMKRLLTSIILDFRLFDAVKASVPN